MDKLKKTTIAITIITLVLFGVSYLSADKKYGATIYTTATTDTFDKLQNKSYNEVIKTNEKGK